MRQVARQVLPEQAVGQEKRADDRQGYTHDAACGFEYQHDQQKADHHVALGKLAGALDQLAFENPLVGCCCHARKTKQPGQRLPGAAIAVGGVAQVDHQQQEAHMDRAQDLSGNQRESRSGDLEDRERQGNSEETGRPAHGVDVQPMGGIAHAGSPAVACPGAGRPFAQGSRPFSL
ncbi:hypothetical protein D9M68_680020 [compost metagenome]